MSTIRVRTSAHARARWNGGHQLEPFEASYPGTCQACGNKYLAGDMIKSLGKGLGASHNRCPAARRQQRRDYVKPAKAPSAAKTAQRAQVRQQIRAWGSRTTP